jgi:hypothetical protein
MVKTFYITSLDAKEVLRRIHALGILDYNMSWGVDLDEKLNALTFRVSYTAGSEGDERETGTLKEIEKFIKSIDIEKPPEKS